MVSHICHVNLAKGFRGGERQTQLLIEHLAPYGLRQTLVARYDSPLFARLAGTPGLRMLPVYKPYWLHLARLRRDPPDLLHAHDAKAAQWALLNHGLRGTPYVMTRRMSRPSKDIAFTRAVYRRAAQVIGLTRAVRDGVHRIVPDVDVLIIPSMFARLPVDPQRVAALRARYAGRFVIGHIGALINPHKGQAVLIQAMRRLRHLADLHVLLLGTGRDERVLKAMAADLPNVEFVGFVDNVGDWIAVFDLFAFPSLEEGLGSSLLDVMAQAKPIVATATGGILDVIEDGVNGLLVPPRDAAALAEAIERLYHDPALRTRLGEAGLRSLERYAPETVAAQHVALYRRLLQAP
ncbi:MAG: glycosyl transferase [Gammaproteobacteria bacterium]|nr:MAG: glycosyl transferase [Gammaproteobacteria bacterium]